jgi:tetratricopeptide (TPR) repeat protein
MSETPNIHQVSTETELREAEAEQKYQKATLKFENGDLDEALMLLRTCLSLCPGSWKYHYNIAYLYWRKDLLEIAVNHYKLFLKYAPQQDPDRETITGRIKWLETEIKKRRQIR